jgi:hypothetical protein
LKPNYWFECGKQLTRSVQTIATNDFTHEHIGHVEMVADSLDPKRRVEVSTVSVPLPVPDIYKSKRSGRNSTCASAQDMTGQN